MTQFRLERSPSDKGLGKAKMLEEVGERTSNKFTDHTTLKYTNFTVKTTHQEWIMKNNFENKLGKNTWGREGTKTCDGSWKIYYLQSKMCKEHQPEASTTRVDQYSQTGTTKGNDIHK